MEAVPALAGARHVREQSVRLSRSLITKTTTNC